MQSDAFLPFTEQNKPLIICDRVLTLKPKVNLMIKHRQTRLTEAKIVSLLIMLVFNASALAENGRVYDLIYKVPAGWKLEIDPSFVVKKVSVDQPLRVSNAETSQMPQIIQDPVTKTITIARKQTETSENDIPGPQQDNPSPNPSESVASPDNDESRSADNSYAVYKGQNLRRTLQDVALLLGYTRVIIDLSPGSVDPSQYRAESKMQLDLSSPQPQVLKNTLVKAYPQIEFLYVGSAKDGQNRALVLSNQGYEAWDELTLFDVQPGMLQENASRLAESFGWKIPKTGYWQSDVDYEVPVSFSIVTKDIIHAFSRLFSSYPLQARLIDSTKQVVVVNRATRSRR